MENVEKLATYGIQDKEVQSKNTKISVGNN